MYYREEIIDGVLCYKSSPRGEWTPLSAKALTNKIKDLQKLVKEAY